MGQLAAGAARRDLADLLASGLNPSVAGGDHAGTYIEHAVLNWLKNIVGAPPDAGAVLTSGGSVATLVGLAVMRHVKTGGLDRRRGLAERDGRLIVYASTQGHACIQKAVEILGFGSDQLRRVPVDADFRMDLTALQSLVAADRASGLHPVAVVASAGTVNTGAIDPLEALADFCASADLWLHVDGAYGGVAALDPATRPLLAGLERADSLGVDPHKWLYIPVECGCAIVRDAQAMRNTFSLVPPYLRDDAAMPWFSEFTVQQTRGFRALKLWMVLQQVGLDAYGRLIASDIARARTLRARLRRHGDFEIVSEGPLSITCFRYVPAWAERRGRPQPAYRGPRAARGPGLHHDDGARRPVRAPRLHRQFPHDRRRPRRADRRDRVVRRTPAADHPARPA